jgi:hypothetical protein
MTFKEQLVQEIGSAPERLVIETLDFLRFLKAKDRLNLSTGQSLHSRLKTMGTWQGDDFDDCLQSTIDNRLPVEFDSQPNPFD